MSIIPALLVSVFMKFSVANSFKMHASNHQLTLWVTFMYPI